MAKKKKSTKRNIETYAHTDKERVNNPPVGLVTPDTDKDEGKKTYAYDPHLDPQLQWAGKAEHTSFHVPTVSLHVHERIDPRTIVEAVRKRNGSTPQMSLFAAPEENPTIRQAIEFYKHRHNWTNRLIAGDSLLVMNSLLEKEGLGGQVQMVYIDPPYGIRYGSNFQPFVNKRDVTDGKDEDLTSEPEQIRAFRDTWELGIHSYLAYLRDRLLLARELLRDSGSCFVQIGDENVHRAGMILDDVFGATNRLATISFATTSGSSTSHLPQVADYLLWYAKDKDRVKYRQLYETLTRAEIVDYFSWHAMVKLPDSRCRKLTDEECFDPDRYLPEGARLYRRTGLDSQGVSVTGRSEPYEWNNRIFHCGKNRQWSISREGLDRLAKLGRLDALEGQDSLMWKKYENEVPGRRINNIWPAQMYPSEKKYVVETSMKAIQRCLLMTTDPGDLIFDPTCGSGTTACVAEQWGRRWITCDTSRVALTLAKQRLMTSVYDYYELAHSQEGVGSGFKYKTVPKVSPKILANEEPSSAITLYDQPLVDRTKTRVTGPFTVEAVPAPVVKPIAEIADPHPGPHPNPLPEGEGVMGEGVGRPLSDPLPSGEGGRRPGEGKKAIDPNLLQFARKLRQEQTDAEHLLWQLLQNKQLCKGKFRRQHPVAPYVLDFYCHEERLGIELDGGQHNEPDARRTDKERTAFLEGKGIRIIRFWNNEVLQNTEAVLEQLYDTLTPTLSQGEREQSHPQTAALTADASVARMGETVRQGDWRDELLKTGIRGKAGQHISFARLEPLPGTRWLHAEGETRPDDAGADRVCDGETAWSPERVVVSFGPDHAPMEQRQIALAIEDAQTLVPKPKIVIFAAFQFDPEASKDIDETNWPGVTLLKAQMNADLLTDDLKKKRASNESFWLIGQPDVEVVSFEFLVLSDKEIASYDLFKELSGLNRLAEIRQLGQQDLQLYLILSQGRDVWHYLANEKGWHLYPSQHSRRTSQTKQKGIPAIPVNIAGLVSRVRDFYHHLHEFGISERNELKNIAERLRRNSKITSQLEEIAQKLNLPTKNSKLTTANYSQVNYSQVTIHGFDYYNTKTGNVESGGKDKIALWMLDPDYDGRSLFPRQVFFPMAGDEDGWAKLARNLKAEIDTDLIETYRGTTSLPFKAGEHQRIAVKIIDDRGIESLKIVELE